MSASSGYVMEKLPKAREQERAVAPTPATGDQSETSFWHWFALGVLLFCWIAEATMCAERGF